MSQYRIAVLPGDGIGPEVIASAQAVLLAVADRSGLDLDFRQYDAGAGSYERTGIGITETTLAHLGDHDAVLLGAMGLPWVRYADGTEVTPQIDIRERYKLFASLRPARLLPGVTGALTSGAANMLVIRETTEGLFAGRHDPPGSDPDTVSDRLTITKSGSERLFELAFDQAESRREIKGTAKVTLLDKANVLRSFGFFRSIFDEVAKRHPDIQDERLYIDAACMLMVLEPERFDVIVTENQFGDIASELAAGITGGLGIAASADVSLEHAVFQPCHGTAPDLAGRDLANPMATILCAAMLLEWLGDQHEDRTARMAASMIRGAIDQTAASGTRTPDIGGSATTTEVTEGVIAALSSSEVGQ